MRSNGGAPVSNISSSSHLIELTNGRRRKREEEEEEQEGVDDCNIDCGGNNKRSTKKFKSSSSSLCTMEDLPCDVIFIVFEFLEISLSMYVKHYDRNDRYRKYIEDGMHDPVLRIIYGRFKHDSRRTIHRLYKHVYLTPATYSTHDLVDCISLWQARGYDRLNPFAVCSCMVIFDRDHHVVLKKLSQVNRHMESLTLSASYPANIGNHRLALAHSILSARFLSQFRHLKHLELNNSSLIAAFDYHCGKYPNDFNRLESVVLSFSGKSIGNILRLPSLKSACVKSVTERQALNKLSNTTNWNMRELGANLGASCLQIVLKSYPSLKSLATRLFDTKSIELILNSNIEEFICNIDSLPKSSSPSDCPKFTKNTTIRILHIAGSCNHSFDMELLKSISQSKSIRSLTLANETMRTRFMSLTDINMPSLEKFQYFGTKPRTKLKFCLPYYHHDGWLVKEKPQALQQPTDRAVGRRLKELATVKRSPDQRCTLSVTYPVNPSFFRRIMEHGVKWTYFDIYDSSFTDKCLNELVKGNGFEHVEKIDFAITSLSKQAIYWLCKQEKLMFGRWNDF